MNAIAVRQVDASRAWLAAILASAFVSGCIHTRPVHPDSWPEQSKLNGDACPAIDGEYWNAGEAGAPLRMDWPNFVTTVSLAHVLNGKFDSSSYQAADRLGQTYYDSGKDPYRTIRVIHLVDNLRFEATRADGSKAAFELPVQQSCRNSLVTLAVEWDYDSTGPYPVYARSGLAFGRLADGSLLVRTSTKFPTPGAGYRLVLFSESYFYRFLPVKPAATGLTEPAFLTEERPPAGR